MDKVAILLDTWHNITNETLKEFVGKDIMVLHRKKVFVYLPNATLETINRWFDEDSMIIDFSTSDYIKVLPVIPEKPKDLP